MKVFLKSSLMVAVVCASACAALTFAQRPGANAGSAKPASGSYDTAKDASLQGTVLSFTENSQTAPLGAHVLLQTSAGKNPVFLARLVQVGAQVVAVRSDHGLPLGAAGVRANKALLANAQAEQKGGAR